MSKALIVYGSTTGNTETVAQQIAEILAGAEIEITCKNVSDTNINELGNNYDMTILGASTWGDDAIEFQEDFEPFYDQLANAELQGKKVALFGCGDSSYEYFCGAVDLLEEKMQELGANTVNVSLRIDGDPDDAAAEILEWTHELKKEL